MEQAARRAIELSPDLLEGHLILGLARGIFHFDAPGYERSLRQAIELDPRHPNSRRELALHLAREGRVEEALDHAKLAQKLDPLFPEAHVALGYIYHQMGNHRQAARQWAMALELSPDLQGLSLGSPKKHLGWAYWRLGKTEEAISALREANDKPSQLYLCRALGRGNDMEELGREVGQELERLLEQPNPPSWRIAELYVALDDRDEAVRWLNIGRDQSDVYVTNIRLIPLL